MFCLKPDTIDHLQPLRGILHRDAQFIQCPFTGAAVKQRKHLHECIFRYKALGNALIVKDLKSAVKILLIEFACAECDQFCLLPAFRIGQILRELNGEYVLDYSEPWFSFIAEIPLS